MEISDGRTRPAGLADHAVLARQARGHRPRSDPAARHRAQHALAGVQRRARGRVHRARRRDWSCLLGALLADSPHTRPVPVTPRPLRRRLAERLHVEPVDYKGPTGIVGVLQHACTPPAFPAVSLWAAVPHYVAQPPSPKATLALLRGVEDVLDMSLPLADLPEEARAWERGVDELAEQDTEVADYVRTLEEAQGRDRPARGQRRRDRPRVRALPAPPRRPRRAVTPGLSYREARARPASRPAGGMHPVLEQHLDPVPGGLDLSRVSSRSKPAPSSSPAHACRSLRRAWTAVGQTAAPPLPQHGPQLVLLGEADAVVAAVQVTAAVGQQVTDLAVGVVHHRVEHGHLAQRRVVPARDSAMMSTSRPRRSTAGTCRARTARPASPWAAPRPSPPRGHRVRRHLAARQRPGREVPQRPLPRHRLVHARASWLPS